MRKNDCICLFFTFLPCVCFGLDIVLFSVIDMFISLQRNHSVQIRQKCTVTKDRNTSYILH